MNFLGTKTISIILFTALMGTLSVSGMELPNSRERDLLKSKLYAAICDEDYARIEKCLKLGAPLDVPWYEDACIPFINIIKLYAASEALLGDDPLPPKYQLPSFTEEEHKKAGAAESLVGV